MYVYIYISFLNLNKKKIYFKAQTNSIMTKRSPIQSHYIVLLISSTMMLYLMFRLSGFH